MRYRLLKELPNAAKGTWFNLEAGEFSTQLYKSQQNRCVHFTKELVENSPDWFEKDNYVFDSKRIHDRMQELKEQEDAFNAARKGLKNTVADERTFHGEYYKDFNDYQVKKITKKLNSVQLKYFHKLAGTYYKKEIWQGIANNVSDLLNKGVSNEEIGEYLKTQFEILGK